MNEWRYVILEVCTWDKPFPEDNSTGADWVADPEKYGLPWCDGDIETLVYHDVSFFQFLKWKILPLVEDTKENIKYFFEYRFPKKESFLIRFGHLEATCIIDSTFWSAGTFWTRGVWDTRENGTFRRMRQMLFDDMWSYE